MRVLFFGDMAPTGFGTVTQDLGRALLNIGHDVRFTSQNDVGDLPEPFASRTFSLDPRLIEQVQEAFRASLEGREAPEDSPFNPDKIAAFGANSLALTSKGAAGLLDGSLWADGWKAEAVIILGDYRGVRMLVMADDFIANAFASIPSFHYVPIEGIDLPPLWGDLWKIVRPVAMSKFGAEQIKLVTGSEAPVVWHGVDTDTFRPVSPERPIYLEDRVIRDKASAKRFFGGHPKERWIVRADRNMPRKRYASFIRAMVPVLARRPDTKLIIHCRAHDEGGNLVETLSKVPKQLLPQIVLPGWWERRGPIPREALAALYNAADVYASPSAEGFGLTIAEAMACGVPAVGIAYSSVPEVIGPGGLLAPVNHLLDNEYDHAWAAVDEQAFGDQVSRLLDDPFLRQQLGRAARAHVVENFQWSKAALQMSGVLRESQAVAA